MTTSACLEKNKKRSLELNAIMTVSWISLVKLPKIWPFSDHKLLHFGFKLIGL